MSWVGQVNWPVLIKLNGQPAGREKVGISWPVQCKGELALVGVSPIILLGTRAAPVMGGHSHAELHCMCGIPRNLQYLSALSPSGSHCTCMCITTHTPTIEDTSSPLVLRHSHAQRYDGYVHTL